MAGVSDPDKNECTTMATESSLSATCADSAWAVSFADLNGDGAPDLAWQRQCQDGVEPRRRPLEGLTVEVRAVEPPASAKKTRGDLLSEIGRWEGESGAELDALFTRQRGNRQVPDLP
jgi:hypothetical protein